jgi:hypothetical protein
VQESLSHPALNARLRGEQEGLTCSFPRWSPEAVITEAARNWNLLHPGRPFDPAGSDWAFACLVINSWLRHAVSNYDVICTPANRSELQKEIRHRARLAYPWLSAEIDPRDSGNTQLIVRPFDQIGGFSRSYRVSEAQPCWRSRTPDAKMKGSALKPWKPRLPRPIARCRRFTAW